MLVRWCRGFVFIASLSCVSLRPFIVFPQPEQQEHSSSGSSNASLTSMILGIHMTIQRRRRATRERDPCLLDFATQAESVGVAVAAMLQQ